MKIDWKKAIGLTAAVAMLVPLAACGGSSDGDSKSDASGTENITLSVWAPQEDQAKDTNWLGQVEENFAKNHPEYNITWKNDVVSEGDVSKQVSTDPSAAADVYMFASDQLGVLMDAKAIGQLGTDAEKQVKEQTATSKSIPSPVPMASSTVCRTPTTRGSCTTTSPRSPRMRPRTSIPSFPRPRSPSPAKFLVHQRLL